MKAQVDIAALAVSAGAGAVAVVANDLSLALFGVPIVQWSAAVSGAIFGVAFLPTASESRLSRPWTVLACVGAGVFLGRLAAHFAGIQEPAAVSGITFVIAAAPTVVLRFVLRRLTGE